MRSQNIVWRKVFSNFQFVFQSVMLQFFFVSDQLEDEEKSRLPNKMRSSEDQPMIFYLCKLLGNSKGNIH